MQVSLFDGMYPIGNESVCPEFDMSADPEQVTQACYGHCGNDVYHAKFKATPKPGATEFRMCKIGYFLDETPSIRSTQPAAFDTVTPGTNIFQASPADEYFTYYDLHSTATKSITLPVDGCLTLTSWSLNLRGQTDDLLVTMTDTFSVDSLSLNILPFTTVPMNFARMKELYGTDIRQCPSAFCMYFSAATEYGV